MENNLALDLKRGEKRKSYIENSSAIVCGVLSTPPFSKQAGVLDAYMPCNSRIMKQHESKATGH